MTCSRMGCSCDNHPRKMKVSQLHPGDIFDIDWDVTFAVTSHRIFTYLCLWVLPHVSPQGERRYRIGAFRLGEHRWDEFTMPPDRQVRLTWKERKL